MVWCWARQEWHTAHQTGVMPWFAFPLTRARPTPSTPPPTEAGERARARARVSRVGAHTNSHGSSKANARAARGRAASRASRSWTWIPARARHRTAQSSSPCVRMSLRCHLASLVVCVVACVRAVRAPSPALDAASARPVAVPPAAPAVGGFPTSRAVAATLPDAATAATGARNGCWRPAGRVRNRRTHVRRRGP